MVSFNATGTFAIVETQTYQLNIATASALFTNTWDGNAPSVSCTGSPTACSNPAPPAPPAPAPDPNVLAGPNTKGNIGHDGIVGDNKCTLLNGGTLTSGTYTQTVKVSVGSGATGRTYTYTYTYNVTPTSNPVAALTAWDLVNDNGGGLAHVDVGANIAGESALSSAKHDLKYSFSIVDGDGNRVQNLVVTVTDVNTSAVVGTFPAGSTVVTNAPGALVGDPGALDFLYTTNAGSNGVTSLLTNGDARTILNTDSFAGNQNGGADGSALAWAVMDTVGLDLGPGDYTVTLTGVVKGNSASANLPFSVSQTLHIIGQGCGPIQ
jgi:hypothetical protein